MSLKKSDCIYSQFIDGMVMFMFEGCFYTWNTPIGLVQAIHGLIKSNQRVRIDLYHGAWESGYVVKRPGPHPVPLILTHSNSRISFRIPLESVVMVSHSNSRKGGVIWEKG